MPAFDVMVIGSGPGGYVAAIRAAQLGLTVACVERDKTGGVCLNWGCIPTKALLRSAEILDLCRRADEFGVRAENVGFDLEKLVGRSRRIADKHSSGIELLFKKNNVALLRGAARISTRTARGFGVAVAQGTGEQVYEAGHVILATGARAKSLPHLEPDGDRIITYKEALMPKSVPPRLLVLGGGAIGCEFASFFRDLGSEVTLIEALDQIVPIEDADVGQALARSFRKRGITVRTKTTLEEAHVEGNAVRARLASAEGRSELMIDRILVAVGVRANTEGLGLEALGVRLERGFVEVDEGCATSVDRIWAIGDVTGPPALAHVASAEAVHVAERIAGRRPTVISYDAIPACIYCRPEVASVGLTEARARERHHEVKIGRFPFSASGKASAIGDTDGFVKIVVDARTGEILGAHLVGHGVTELLAEPTLARTGELSAEDLLATVHPHPTLSEAIKGAAEAALGHAIDL